MPQFLTPEQIAELGGRRVDVLGHRGPVLLEPGVESQLRRLYTGDQSWTRVDPNARKTVSLEGARDMVEQMLHSSQFDEIPGIGDVRNDFRRENIRFAPHTHTRIDGSSQAVADGRQWHELGNGRVGGLTAARLPGYGGEGRGVMSLRPGQNGDPEDVTRLGTVSHETAHLINAHLGIPNAAGHEWPMARTHLATAGVLGAAGSLERAYRGSGVDTDSSRTTAFLQELARHQGFGD